MVMGLGKEIEDAKITKESTKFYTAYNSAQYRPCFIDGEPDMLIYVPTLCVDLMECKLYLEV
jgi:hypothetical protein